MKQSGGKSDKKQHSVQKSPSTKCDTVSTSSVTPAMLKVRRPLLQDDDIDDDVLQAGQLAASEVQPMASVQQVLTCEISTVDDLPRPASVTGAHDTSHGQFSYYILIMSVALTLLVGLSDP